MTNKKNKAFTLTELMIVVFIVSILVTISMPLYFNVVERSRIAEAYAQFGLIRQAELNYYNQNGLYTNRFTDLDMQNLSAENDPNSYFEYTLLALKPPDLMAIAKRNNFRNARGRNYGVNLYTNWDITVTGF